MYTTSADFKTVINNPSRKFECKAICGDKTYTNTNIVSINITGSLQPSGYTIGSAISQKATFKFINNGQVTFPSNTISLEIGLLVNGTYEYVPFGNYNIDDHSADDYTITVTAYDNMTKLEQMYTGTGTTLRAIAQEICTNCGVTLGSTIPTTTVTTPSSGKYTNREVIGYIAGCMCGNAVIDRTGQLIIQKLNLSTINKEVTTDNWFTYKNADMIFQIEQLICDTGTETKLTSGSTEDRDKQLTIKNPLMTQAMLDSARTELSGITFTGFNVKYQGDISTDLGDTVKITDRNSNTLTAPLLQRTLNYNGGLTENIKTEGKKKVDVANSYYGAGRYSSYINNMVGTDWTSEINDLNNRVTSLELENDQTYHIFVIDTNYSTKTDKLTYSLSNEGLETDWGDGTIDTKSTHTYANHGTYRIVSRGITRYYTVITEVIQLRTGVTSFSGYFRDETHLTKCCDIPEGVTNCAEMFLNTKINIAPKLASTTTDSNNMFANCQSLVSAKGCLEKVNNSNCYRMFYNCQNLVYAPELTGARDCGYMFYNCKKLTVAPSLTSVAKYTISMFENCSMLVNMADMSEVTDVTDTTEMYCDCIALIKSEPISDSVTNATGMMKGCTSLVVPPALGDGIIDATSMFEGCVKLTQTPVFVDSLVTCYRMFYGCTKLVTTYPLTNNIENCNQMFYNCASLSNFMHMSTSVTNCEYMFYGCSKLSSIFSLPVGLLNCKGMFSNCTSILTLPFIPNTVTNCYSMFEGCSKLSTVPSIPNSVTNCYSMFEGCVAIVSPPTIGSGVTNAIRMFSGCTGLTYAPQLPGSVTDCNKMFMGCTSIVTANITIPSGVTDCTDMFYLCTELTLAPGVIPSTVLYTSEMFRGCTKLKVAPVLRAGLINADRMFQNAGIEGNADIPSTIVDSTRMYCSTPITGISGDTIELMDKVKEGENTTWRSHSETFWNCQSLVNPDTFENLKTTYSTWF